MPIQQENEALQSAIKNTFISFRMYKKIKCTNKLVSLAERNGAISNILSSSALRFAPNADFHVSGECFSSNKNYHSLMRYRKYKFNLKA